MLDWRWALSVAVKAGLVAKLTYDAYHFVSSYVVNNYLKEKQDHGYNMNDSFSFNSNTSDDEVSEFSLASDISQRRRPCQVLCLCILLDNEHMVSE